MRRTFWLTLLAGILLVSAACGDTSPTADDIIDSTIQAVQSISDYQASVDLSFTAPESGELSMDVVTSGSLTMAMLGGEPPQFRGDVTESTLNVFPEGTIVVFASTSYLYDPAQDTLFTASQGRGGNASQLYRLPLLFLNTMNDMVQTLTSSGVDRTLEGEEDMHGFTTYKIVATPNADAASSPLAEGESLTVWVDKESSLPVQITSSNTEGEQTLSVTSMEVNAGIDESVFTVEPPEGAAVVDMTEPEPVADLEEASDLAGFAAPTPGYLPESLPTDPSTVEFQQTPLGNMISQTYATQLEGETSPDGSPATGAVHISALNATNGLPEQLPAALPPGANTSTVDVNGAEGLLLSIGEGQATLSWQQEDTVYIVRGSGFGQDEVVQVAENLTTQ
jgi:outer membrane lipoprotein-sorting protein